jgi:hypothetical protein
MRYDGIDCHDDDQAGIKVESESFDADEIQNNTNFILSHLVPPVEYQSTLKSGASSKRTRTKVWSHLWLYRRTRPPVMLARMFRVVTTVHVDSSERATTLTRVD